MNIYIFPTIYKHAKIVAIYFLCFRAVLFIQSYIFLVTSKDYIVLRKITWFLLVSIILNTIDLRRCLFK